MNHIMEQSTLGRVENNLRRNNTQDIETQSEKKDLILHPVIGRTLDTERTPEIAYKADFFFCFFVLRSH